MHVLVNRFRGRVNTTVQRNKSIKESWSTSQDQRRDEKKRMIIKDRIDPIGLFCADFDEPHNERVTSFETPQLRPAIASRSISPYSLFWYWPSPSPPRRPTDRSIDRCWHSHVYTRYVSARVPYVALPRGSIKASKTSKRKTVPHYRSLVECTPWDVRI